MATTPLAAATPSPPPHIHTPPTPRLGFADSWEPFSPRKSSRIAAAASASSKNTARPSAAARTPSPSAATRRAVRQLRSPRVSKQAAVAAPALQNDIVQPHPQHRDVASFSPAPTPRKKKTMPTAHFLSPEDALKSGKKAASQAAAQAAASEYSRMGTGMLPTPAKTPSKKYHASSQNESNIAAIARNLFHHSAVDEVMASPSKKPSTPSRKPKKYTGFSLESFAVVEDEIPIFTDSQDRVPEADSSVENPFFGDGAIAGPSAPEPTRRRSKRNHVSIPGEGQQTVEDATRREDGLVYVFRGKKIFRKFEDNAEAQEEDILDGMSSSGKRLTRSAIKPRLLFPREDSLTETTPNGGTIDDEEADTDIEDHNMHSDDEEVEEEEEVEVEVGLATATPADLVDSTAPNTPPRAPKFAPASPPVTGRATRSGHKSAEDLTPVKAVAAPKKRSPFDGWRQTKSSASTVAGHKRPVDALGSSPSSSGPKRSRA